MHDAHTAALRYLQLGFAPIPIPTRSKNPNRSAWQEERWTRDDNLAALFDGGNVGLLNGEPSGGLVDIDLDCAEAIQAAPVLLPATSCIFGRASRRRSHYLYRCVPGLPTKKYADPLTRATLVELRSTGTQTVVPPSTHPLGETITFDADGDVPVVDAAVLSARVGYVTATALLARAWPNVPGARHDLALALAGFLLRAGLEAVLVEQVIGLAASIAGDGEWRDRAAGVRSTAARVRAGAPVTGGPTLTDLLDARVTARVRLWLGGRDAGGARAVVPAAPPSSADAVPPLPALLAAIETLITKYIIIPERGLVAVVLWIAHTHAIGVVDATPYLHVRSPQPRCGKSRLLEVVAALVRCPWSVVQPSEAVLYRKVARDQPTLLLDEIDAVFGKASESTEGVRALLNAGNRRGVTIPRCQAKSLELVEFPVFCAKMFAGIGALPHTVADRAIPVDLARRTKGEQVTRLRARVLAAEAGPVQQQLAAWAAAAVPQLRQAAPSLPDSLNDRAQDAWEPLLAIADLAGGGWPARARCAAVALHPSGEGVDETVGILLLRAIAQIFAATQAERLSSSDLLTALAGRDGEPWGAWWGQALDRDDTRGPGYRLGKLLHPFGLASKDLRVGAHTRKGFERSDFVDVFARYLNDATTTHPLSFNGLDPETRGDGRGGVSSSNSVQPLEAEGGSRRRVDLAGNEPAEAQPDDDVEEGRIP